MIACLASVSVRGLLRLARLLPLRLVEGIGSWFGWAAWACDIRHRRVALRNLARVFDRSIDDPWVRRTARASFVSAGRSMASAAWLMGQSEAGIRRHVVIHGSRHVRQAVGEGRGVIAAVAHFGPWEALAAVPLVLEEVPPATMARPIRNRGVDHAVQRLRRRFGIEVFAIPGGYRDAARFLKRPGILAILVDQYAGSSGRWVPFLGVPASTTRAHASLARMTGAVVLTTSVRRTGRDLFEIRMHAPVAVNPAGEERFLAEVNGRLAADIVSSPRDWFWMHNRWRLPRRFLALDPGAGARPRLLVRGANWLGDAVMSLPAIRRIRETSPQAHVAVLGPPAHESLYAAFPGVDEFIPRPGGGPWRAARRVRSGRFDAAFVLPNSLRSGLEVFLAGIPRRIGYGGWGRRAVLTDIVPGDPRDRRHQAQRYLDIIGAAGAGTDLAPPRLEPSEADRERARSVLGDRGPGVIGLHAGAQYGPAKRWPADRFAALAATFAGRGYRVVLFGGGDEAGLAGEIASKAGENGILNLAGRTGLDELAALLACCDVVVANDTGPMHLAAAVGTCVVALFGSTDPGVSAPLGRVCVVREPVACSPCFRRTCPIDFPCMMRIDAARVAAAVDSFLEAGTDAADKRGACE